MCWGIRREISSGDWLYYFGTTQSPYICEMWRNQEKGAKEYPTREEAENVIRMLQHSAGVKEVFKIGDQQPTHLEDYDRAMRGI